MAKADDVLKQLTDDDVIDIMRELGSDEHRFGKGCVIFRAVCHGIGKLKDSIATHVVGT